MSAHAGHLACVESSTSTCICARVERGGLVVATGPGTVGWWPASPGELRRFARELQVLADLMDLDRQRPAVDGQLELFGGAA